MATTLEGFVIGDKLTCIFKGDPGTGKTIAAASFSEGKEDIYFFDLDQRIRPLVLHFNHPELKSYKERIKFDTYTGDAAWATCATNWMA